jgi:hypothetical protein
MKKIKVIHIGIASLVILAVVLIGVLMSPYRLKRTLPQITAEQVEKVVILSGVSKRSLQESEGLEVDKLVEWYNQSREVKSDAGTTPDIGIEILLKDKRVITIWTLYSKNWVTVVYESGDGAFYETNVSSAKLAGFIEGIRQGAGIN